MTQGERNRKYKVSSVDYRDLDQAMPEQRRDIILRLIQEHPENRLELPERGGRQANLEGADLQGIVLTLANLQGANLRNANLQGTCLLGANLQGACLIEANLQKAFLRDANLQGDLMIGAKLQDAFMLRAVLHRANLSGADLHGACLLEANLQEVDLLGANLLAADLGGAKLQGVDLSVCRSLEHVGLAGAWLDRTRLRWEQLGGAIQDELAAKTVEPAYRATQYGEAKGAYLLLKQNFDDLGDYDASSKAYRKERRMEKLAAWYGGRAAIATHQWRKAASLTAKATSDLFVELLCDYGESVWRVLGFMVCLLLILGPALIALSGGLTYPEGNLRYYGSLSSPLVRQFYAYGQCLLYMLDTFTTASFSALRPATDGLRFVSGFMAIVGIALTGLLGFVVGNRIRRS